MTGARLLPPATGWVRLAIAQGITAQVLFALTAIIGGALRPGYSHFSQAISELTEAGAINKPYLDLALLGMELLTIIFGIGLFIAVRRTGWRLSATSLLLVAIGCVGLLFARYPMDPMGSPMTFDGQMHLVIVAVSAVAALAAVALAASGWARVAGGHGLGRLSWVILAIMLASGVMSAITALSGWPGIGVWQRVNTGAFSLWQIALVVFVLRRA